uniref:G-protein coupled receptors family 1 profile domain-containing protein n=1 Tax=Romanomermis culicivorax TaxID=13658 RepID=A0A915KJE8_ROMCU
MNISYIVNDEPYALFPGDSNLYAYSYIFIVLGSFSFATNFLMLIVLFSDKQCRRKSLFMIVLGVGDSVNGLALAVTGIWRLIFLLDGGRTMDALVDDGVCFLRFTFLWILGTQLPSFIILMASGDRLAAVLFYKWYLDTWSSKKIVVTISMLILICGTSTVCSTLILVTKPGRKVETACYTPSVVGHVYANYHYSVALTCSTVSVISVTWTSFLIRRQIRRHQLTSNSTARLNKEWTKNRSLICLSLIDLIFVAIPTFLILLALSSPSLSIDKYFDGFRSSILITFRSSLNIFVNLYFNKRFNFSVKIFLLPCLMKNRVSPLTPDSLQH